MIISGNLGKMTALPEDLVTKGETITGFGITYGYKSIIGPIELSLMDSPSHDLIAYVNIGFWF